MGKAKGITAQLCICFPLCLEPLFLGTYMAASLAFGSQPKCPLPTLGLSLTTYLKKALLSYHRIILFYSLSSSYRYPKFFYIFHLLTCFLPKSWELHCLKFVLVSVISPRLSIKFLIGLCWTNEQISVSPSPLMILPLWTSHASLSMRCNYPHAVCSAKKAPSLSYSSASPRSPNASPPLGRHQDRAPGATGAPTHCSDVTCVSYL